MKNIKCFIASMITFCSCIVFAEQNVTLFRDTNGNKVNVLLNEEGIITSVEGSLSGQYLSPLSIFTEEKEIHIHSKWSLFEDCFDIYLNPDEEKLSVNVKNNKTKEVYSSEIKLNQDNLPCDEFKTIEKNAYGYGTITSEKSYSLLPDIQYTDGIAYYFIGNSKDLWQHLWQKYIYNENHVELYIIMPGDVWRNYLSLEIGNIKSDNTITNIINYIIINCLEESLGTIMFPVLFDMEDNSKYLECNYNADSFLIEGNVKYIPENLMTSEIGKPWVEGIDGDGIGSKIYIESKHEEKIAELVFSNGFVSKKSQTYFNNNRVKRVLIKNNDGSQMQEVMIPDSSKPCTVRLNFQSSKITIEILEVYKGEKYKDTCINYILCK